MRELFALLADAPAHGLAGWRDGQAANYGELRSRIRAWTALARRTAGVNLALYHADSIEFAAALLGCWQAGKTVWLAADTLPATCTALAQSVNAFFGAGYPADAAAAVPAAGDDCQQAWHTLAADFPALVVHTSGSTGAPKAIPKMLAQLETEVAALEQQFGTRIAGAEILATVSHQHIYGLLFRVLWPLAAGRPIDARALDLPEALAVALARRRCVLVASPAHLKRLPAHLDWHGAARQLAAVFSSGGELTKAAALHVQSLLRQAPLEVYGSSETGGIAWRQQDADGASAAWLALPQVQWRVQDGLLQVNSPFAGPGSWLPMADLAEDAGAGRFLLRGRADRIVKVEQKRISLEAIEQALAASDLVAEARVIACPVDAGGLGRDTLAAFVVPSGTGRALLDGAGKAALKSQLRVLLAPIVDAVALPRRWRFLDHLPVNAQGKISQGALLAMLSDSARPRLPLLDVLEQTPERALLALAVPSDLLYYDGHFDVAPVLPGVVQVDWAILFGRRLFAIDGAFDGMQTLKFQQMIRPGCAVRLELGWDAGKRHLHFRYLSDAGSHASGRILFAAPVSPAEEVC